jgi:hypothetical protein
MSRAVLRPPGTRSHPGAFFVSLDPSALILLFVQSDDVFRSAMTSRVQSVTEALGALSLKADEY